MGLMGAPLALMAQENTMNQDVRVVREYTPTISDATKFDQMPVLDDTSSYKPVFKYTILSRPIETPGKIEPISPARLSNERSQPFSTTRIKAGLGLNKSLMGELDYNMPANKDYLFALSLSQYSSWGKVSLPNSQKSDAPSHRTFAGAEMKRFFPTTTLSSHINFKRHAYNYYGYQTFDSLQNYTVPGYSNPINGKSMSVSPGQRTSSFSLGVGLQNRESDTDNLQWAGSFDFSSFGNKTGVKQNKVDLSGKIHLPLNNFYFNGDAEMSFYNVNMPDTIGPMYNFDNRQISYIKLLPRVGYNFGNGYVEGGLLLSTEMGRDDDEVRAAPHIYAQLDVAQGIVSIFGGLSAHLNLNDYASVQSENPFISPDASVKSSFYGTSLLGGIKGNFSSAASFSARVEYSQFKDEHFYINQTYRRAASTTIDYVNRFGVIYDDGSLLKVGGELLLTPTQIMSFKLSGNYYGWSLNNLDNAWQKPNMDLGLGAIIKPITDFRIEAELTYVGQRKALILESTPVEKQLDGFIDLNIGLRYDYTRNWSFWAQLNNLTAKEYQQWCGYPSYKIQALIGAAYCF